MIIHPSPGSHATRATLVEVGLGALAPEPGDLLKLVVNVSAPEGSGLDWEGESYRITKALTASCELTPSFTLPQAAPEPPRAG